MASNKIDTDIDNYTREDLLDLLDLSSVEDVNEDDVMEATRPLITRFSQENDNDLAYFFTEVQNKLLEELDDDDTEEYNEQHDETTQLGNWYQNEHLTQSSKVQSDKVTDRTHKVEVFDNDGANSKMVMKQQQLGVNQTYNLPVAQGTINPNLKNINTRLVNIDSQYRENIFPFTTNTGSPSCSTDFTFDLTDPLFKTTSLKLYSIQIPYSWYVIDSQKGNNCFFIDSSSVIIEDGNYSPTELINEIQNHLTVDFSGIDISYNTRNGKSTFTNNSSTDISMTFYDPNGGLVCDGGCNQNSKINSNLGWVLGFRGQLDTSTNEIVMVYNVPNTSTPIGNNTLVSESLVDTYGPKYFLLVIDDFNQNHLNKGLVGINSLNRTLKLPSYWNADLSCNTLIKPVSYIQSAPRRLSQAQLYTLNEITQSRKATTRNRLSTPTTTDVLGLIPIDKNGAVIGQQIIEDGSTLQLNQRTYFGPVDIERMRVRLVDDKGYTVNLNGADWSFSLIATILYQY
tara:strand:+ start:18006 stop:19541 length:1536 start_codon:yes stop_codon:yes gene_type:complete